MKRLIVACILIVLSAPLAWAGVVIEMAVTDPGAGGAAATDTIYAQGEMLRMDPHDGRRADAQSMLFRDDTLWIIDHDKKRCQTMDKEGIAEISAQVGGAMKQMQEQMANLPPEQRAMMEKMMKSRMPGGMGEPAAPRRVETGGTETVGDYTCTVHTLYSGERKVWEVCAADPSAVSGFADAMGAFQAMSRFTEQLREAVQQGPLAGMIETPFSDMDEVGGVPIRVRLYSNGELSSESTLKSIAERDLDADVFSVPEGYKTVDLADQMKKGKEGR